MADTKMFLESDVDHIRDDIVNQVTQLLYDKWEPLLQSLNDHVEVSGEDAAKLSIAMSVQIDVKRRKQIVKIAFAGPKVKAENETTLELEFDSEAAEDERAGQGRLPLDAGATTGEEVTLQEGEQNEG